MKSSELRIGNLVQVYLLDETTNDKYYFCSESQLIGFIKGDLIFKAVPIDESWLEEFMFDSFGLKNEYWQLDSYTPIELLDQGEEYTVFDSGGLKISVIKYVHQLQNLYFALTGEELKTRK